MFQHLQNFLRGDTNPKGHSLIHGRQFALLQKMSKNSMIIEGMTTNTGRANILDDLDSREMDNVEVLVGPNSSYQRLLSDCASSVKIYNDEIMKNNVNYETAENLRNNMVQTCSLMDSTINNLRDNVGNLEKQYNDLGMTMEGNSTPVLEDKLIDIRQREAMLKKLDGQDETLDGEIEDNKLGNDSVYVRYFAWMFASVTMTSIVVHQLLKN
jgi:hypothetical protein